MKSRLDTLTRDELENEWLAAREHLDWLSWNNENGYFDPWNGQKGLLIEMAEYESLAHEIFDRLYCEDLAAIVN